MSMYFCTLTFIQNIGLYLRHLLHFYFYLRHVYNLQLMAINVLGFTQFYFPWSLMLENLSSSVL